jgi:DNA-binding MarR family transcriptional regulator
VRAEVESELANFNLRPRHVIALTVLDVLGEPSQSALAESLRIDRTNLVGLLNEMEAAHLIERRRSGEDRRRHIVALTAVGARRLDEIQDGLAEAESRVFASLDSEQQATLTRSWSRPPRTRLHCPPNFPPPTPARRMSCRRSTSTGTPLPAPSTRQRRRAGCVNVADPAAAALTTSEMAYRWGCHAKPK